MFTTVTGIPLLIVVVSLGATQGEGYGTESSCWLSVENKVIWAFVGPAFLVIFVGGFILLQFGIENEVFAAQWFVHGSFTSVAGLRCQQYAVTVSQYNFGWEAFEKSASG